MCGRTCLTLEPNAILCACKYKSTKTFEEKEAKASKDANENVKQESQPEICNKTEGMEDIKSIKDYIMPEWRPEFNCGLKYAPSYNIAPTDITPVLVSTDHFKDDRSVKEAQQTRVVVPMMWGMIPFWHKGDYRKHGLTTNNCRLEHMQESKLYRGPFRRGQRCVVLCEGFYEWQTTKTSKPSERAAYLLYMPQLDAIKIYDKTTWTPDSVNLLKLAGLFDVWENESGDKIYSYSVITFESSKTINWLHHRMPAVLETEEQINDWLDFERVTDEQALATLRPATQLQWHRVSNIVNNSRNKSDQCNKPLELEKPEVKPMNKTMLAWLNTRKKRGCDTKTSKLSEEELDGIGNTPTKSESDAENPSKRPRFREYKKITDTMVSSDKEK